MTNPRRRRNRVLPVLVALVLAGLIVYLVGWGPLSSRPADTPQVAVVHGVVGSEDQALLRDPRLRAIMRQNGIDLQVDPAGSRQIATTVPLNRYDFAFPSSAPAADLLLRSRPGTTPFAPFSSPMVVATFRPIADLLTRAGVVHGDTFDMRRYLDLVAAQTRWDRLPGNTTFPARKDVLLSSTEPCQSNSAEMYLSIAGYTSGGDTVPASPAAADALLPRLRPLFDRQGYLYNTSDTLFDDYVAAGMGKTPMALLYESQVLSRRLQPGNPLPEGTVLLYPDPTVFARHTLVPLTPAGRKVGDLLARDPRLLDLATQYGFRTADPARLAAALRATGQPAPPQLVNVVEPPRFETLERLVDGLGCQR